MFEAQKFPGRHYTPNGELIRPYDITSWSLSLHRGVDAVEINTPVAGLDEKLEQISIPFMLKDPSANDRNWAIFSSAHNESYKAAFHALKEGINVERTREAFSLDGNEFPAGSFLIPVNRRYSRVEQELLVSPTYTREKPDVNAERMKTPRVGLVETWQIQTAVFLQDEKLPGEFQHGLYFREDGKLMWVFDRTSIWSFTLETPWDITTRSEGTNHDLSHFAQRGHDIDFKPDGTILFIDDRNAGAVYEYTLSTPWDVDSGTLTYTLAEPWNISTAVFFDTFDVSTQTNQGRGLSFSADETIIYVTGRNEEKIFQYELVK